MLDLYIKFQLLHNKQFRIKNSYATADAVVESL